jgi:hypothetical protein
VFLDPHTRAADPAALRAHVAGLKPQERHAALVLSELAPMDVDRDLSHLADMLPPSAAEVHDLLEATGTHLRRALVGHAELRRAWLASRRGMLHVPPPPDLHREYLLGVPGSAAAGGVASSAAGSAPEGAAAGEAAVAAWAGEGGGETEEGGDGGGDDSDTGGPTLTLGDGHVALEYAAANASLRARLRQLEVQLAGQAVRTRQASGDS